MEGVTGMMGRLRHVPGCSRGALYGPANIDFRFVSQLRLQRAGHGAGSMMFKVVTETLGVA